MFYIFYLYVFRENGTVLEWRKKNEKKGNHFSAVSCGRLSMEYWSFSQEIFFVSSLKHNLSVKEVNLDWNH